MIAKPSAMAECPNGTFGLSLIITECFSVSLSLQSFYDFKESNMGSPSLHPITDHVTLGVLLRFIKRAHRFPYSPCARPNIGTK